MAKISVLLFGKRTDRLTSNSFLIEERAFPTLLERPSEEEEAAAADPFLISSIS